MRSGKRKVYLVAASSIHMEKAQRQRNPRDAHLKNQSNKQRNKEILIGIVKCDTFLCWTSIGSVQSRNIAD